MQISLACSPGGRQFVVLCGVRIKLPVRLSPARSITPNIVAHSGLNSTSYKRKINAFDSSAPLARWIEATWQDSDGTLYAWYHHEPSGVCPNDTLTAPQIGALRSTDNGPDFEDLGIVLTALPVINCDAQNGFFAGGNGDFSVMFDSGTGYFYFFFSTYAGDVTDQGVAVARMAYANRKRPRGHVFKYYRGVERARFGGPCYSNFPCHG